MKLLQFFIVFSLIALLGCAAKPMALNEKTAAKAVQEQDSAALFKVLFYSPESQVDKNHYELRQLLEDDDRSQLTPSPERTAEQLNHLKNLLWNTMIREDEIDSLTENFVTMFFSGSVAQQLAFVRAKVQYNKYINGKQTAYEKRILKMSDDELRAEINKLEKQTYK
jgi:hypothetical protein